LAVLSYLGHCETPDSGPYAKNVGDGIRYLMNVGKSNNGRLYLQDRTYLSYEHAIATFALAEAYSMTRDPEIESALRQALPIIIRAQTQQKGWVYSYGSSGIDTSISGWNIQALKAAVTSGLKLEGLQECLDRAIVGINAMQLPNGDWKYNLSDANWRPHLVGVGVYCLETTPTAYPESIRKGIAFMLAEKDHNPGGAYTWYYNTLACFLRGGIAWRQWNDIFQQEMIRTQRADGSWPTRADSPGAKEDQPIYDTCFATLMLEVYYRYLPSSK
jgi:hypothetical protein